MTNEQSKRSNEKDDFRRAWNQRSKYQVSMLVSETTGLNSFYTYTLKGQVIPEFTQEIGGETFVIAFKDSACKNKAGIVLLSGYKLRSR